jgi:metallopeptidase MepB
VISKCLARIKKVTDDYCSSRVYATDMFYSVFKDDPMNSTEGRRYRHTIIGKGASKDEIETLVEFLGREPRAEAFYQELGLL